MQRIDGFRLYALGAALFRMTLVKGKTLAENGTSWRDCHSILLIAQATLEPFIDENLFGLRTSLKPGIELLAFIKPLREKIQDYSKRDNEIDSITSANLHRLHGTFVDVLRYEIPELPLFLVGKKGGHDVHSLVDNGEAFFPVDLQSKAPDAIADIRQGTKYCVRITNSSRVSFSPCKRGCPSCLFRRRDKRSNPTN